MILGVSDMLLGDDMCDYVDSTYGTGVGHIDKYLCSLVQQAFQPGYVTVSKRKKARRA